VLQVDRVSLASRDLQDLLGLVREVRLEQQDSLEHLEPPASREPLVLLARTELWVLLETLVREVLPDQLVTEDHPVNVAEMVRYRFIT